MASIPSTGPQATPMAKPRHFLSLPPELLLRIASDLPLRPLLAFSQTCHLSRALSTKALDRLSFGIYPTQIARQISRIANETDLSTLLQPQRPGVVVSDEHTAAVILPQDPTSTLNIPAMLAFHDTLHGTILRRYAEGLRVLELSLWRIDGRLAGALRALKGLQCVNLRVENPFSGRRAARLGHGLLEEPDGVWGRLEAAWPKLEVLRLDGTAIKAEQLVGLVGRNRHVSEIWLKRCPAAKDGFFDALAGWAGAENLQYLSLLDCGRLEIDQVEPLWAMSSLQVVSLEGCVCADPEEFKIMSLKAGRFYAFQPPQPMRELPAGPNAGIEVDPEFSSFSEDRPSGRSGSTGA